MRRQVLAVFLALAMFSALAHSAERKEYLSPDGKYHTYITRMSKLPYGPGESEIVIKTKNGRTICSKSYSSEDGEHGFGVEKAAWTPDSRFFVYSMSSSGGHQSWRFPIDFFSTADHKIRSFDDYVGPITDPDFALSAPNTVKAIGRDRATFQETTFEVRLSELTAHERKK